MKKTICKLFLEGYGVNSGSTWVEAINKINQQMAPYAKIAKNIEASLAPLRSKALEMQNNLSLIVASVNTKYLHNPEFIRLASQASSIAKIVADLQPETISEVLHRLFSFIPKQKPLILFELLLPR